MIDDFEFGFGDFRIWDWGFMIEDWGRINMGKTPTPKFKSANGYLSPIGDFHF